MDQLLKGPIYNQADLKALGFGSKNTDKIFLLWCMVEKEVHIKTLYEYVDLRDYIYSEKKKVGNQAEKVYHVIMAICHTLITEMQVN